MTRKQLRQGHIELWTWLAETGERDKENWPGWKLNGGVYSGKKCHCFACDCAVWVDIRCNLCPVVWGTSSVIFPCCGDDSPYAEWENTNEEETETRKRLASKIATMWPEEEE